MKQVLVIDSDAVFREYLSMTLEMAFEMEVLEATSSAEAITIIEMEPCIDMIFCAFDDKKFNDDSVYKSIKKIQPYAPFIVIAEKSLQKDPTVLSIVKDFELNSLISKPFNEAEIFNLLEYLVPKIDSFVPSDDLIKNGTNSDEWDSLNNGNNDEEADWSLEKEERGEETADWSVPKKEDNSWMKHVEEKADWSLEKEERGKRSDWEELKEKKEKRRKELEKKRSDLIDPSGKYTPVKIKRFLNFNLVNVDIFIKLNKEKYLKVVGKDLEYDHKQLNNYLKKGVTHLFVLSDEYRNFCNLFSNLLIKNLNNKDLSSAQQTIVGLASTKDLNQKIKEIGIDETSVRQAKGTMESSLDLMEKNPKMQDIFQKILRGEDYISEHSMLICYIATQIARASNWRSASTLEKLSLAAILHDAMIDNEYLAKMSHTSDFKRNDDLSREEIQNIMEHPQKAAQMFVEGNFGIPDVDNIISQHHEKPDGSGFPAGRFANNIAPLSCLFILSEEIAHIIESSKGDKVDHNLIYDQLKTDYNKGNFKKSLEAYKKAFNILSS